MIRKKNVSETESMVAPKFALVLVVFLSISLISVLILQRLANTESTAQPESFEVVQSTQEFVGGEEMNVTAENLTVRIPRNSLGWTGTIAITSQNPIQFLVSGETGWTRPQVFSVEFLNHEQTPVPGIIFSNPIQICFKVTPEQWKDFVQRPDAYQVQYYAVENNPADWVTLPLKAYGGELCGLVNHLSLFALAMRVDSIPITGSSQTPTPTSTRTRQAPTSKEGNVVDPATQMPASTATTVPSVTSSLPPLPTATQPADTPLPTSTPKPLATATQEPTATDPPTLEPTATDLPTDLPTQEATPTDAPVVDPTATP